MTTISTATPLPATQAPPRLNFDAYYELVSFYARYAAALDQGDWDAWPEFFLDECIYKVVPRENYERGLPLAVMDFESKGMLKDRVYGIKETLFYDPYYQRHVVGLPLVHAVRGNLIEAEANYVVLRTKTEQIGDVYNVGRYLDRFRQTSRGLRLESRLCVYDSEMISNSLIYPI
jgi:salicylate 5-hydroxylase small subunit